MLFWSSFFLSFVVRKKYICAKAEPENDGGGCEGRRLCCALEREIEETGVTSTTKCNPCVV